MISFPALFVNFVCFCSAFVLAVRHNARLAAGVGDGLALTSSFVQPPPDRFDDDLSLSDTVLIASIDGKFHALNRTNGQVKWTMHKPRTSSDTDQGPPLHSLVRSTHNTADEDESDPDLDETYIIEPQSGEIFVLPPGASSTTPLEKLPLTIPQLVELSPFWLDVHGEQRSFLGRKETSLITLDIDTGEVISIDDPYSCVWPEAKTAKDAIEADADPEGTSSYDPFDDNTTLRDSQPPRPRRKVVIGRTDYHLAIRQADKGVIQRLTFSAYGPTNVERSHQEHWTKPRDGRYLQPLPDGRVFSFRPHSEVFNSFEWIMPFPKPTVAVFDVVTIPGQQSPIILHQPRPTLYDLFPGPQYHKELSMLDERTYVGIIGESLFAMSHTNFPLVSVDYRFSSGRGSAVTDDEGSSEVALRERECTAVGCLVGTHASGNSASSRFSRLIDANPEKLLIEGPGASSPPTQPTRGLPWQSDTNLLGPSTPGLWESYGLPSAILVLCALVGYVGLVLRRTRQSRGDPPTQALPVEVTPLTSGDGTGDAPTNMVAEAKHSVTFADPPPVARSKPDIEGGEESDQDAEVGEDGEEVKRRRKRKRGKKKPKEDVSAPTVDGAPSSTEAKSDNVTKPDSALQDPPLGGNYVVVPSSPIVSLAVADVAPEPTAPVTALAPTPLPTPPAPASLVVSDAVLGYGSSGTIVYRGSFQGRSVAVKRLLQDFVTVASREVTLLQESDDHPNVIRYFYQESRGTFLYIALELCPASLEDIIARPKAFPEIAAVFQPKRALAQIASGLRHLHSLKIVHRDIKPQNILVSQAKNGAHRMLISDFGLCKKLAQDETSFLPTQHGHLGAGTVGWRAPEILSGEVTLDVASVDSLSGNGTSGDSTIGSIGSGVGGAEGTGTKRTRLTKSVDIFALGCLFFYVLTGGEHPYGGPYERESNIMKNQKDLSWLEKFGEEGEEARDLVEKMLAPNPRERLDTSACLVHPFFWTPARRLGFLADASDRFEIMERDPPEKGLVALETGAYDVVGIDWQRRLDKIFLDNLGKFRKYNGKSVQDLLRALRNKKHHYQDLPDNVKRHLGPLPDGFLGYFTRRFPTLFLHVYYTVAGSFQLRNDSMFASYFALHEDA